MLRFDHIAVGCTSLDAGTKWVEAALGVTLEPGGRHAHFGTHNRLLGLGPDIYLEVIAKDPDAMPTNRPTWFGLDEFDGPPRPTNWICASDRYADDIAIAGPRIGKVESLARGDLSWRITVPEDGSLPHGGAYPTLISWGEGVQHPATKLKDQGVRLVQWIVTHPKADNLRLTANLDDTRVVWNIGSPKLSAVFNTPSGCRVLS